MLSTNNIVSTIVSPVVQKRVIRSPTQKSILMNIADRASDDGTGIWYSKGTIARDPGYGKRTVHVVNDGMMKAGLIVASGSRRCAHGYTVEHRICPDAMQRLKAPQAEPVRKAETTRYDRLARSCGSSVAIAATVRWWT